MTFCEKCSIVSFVMLFASNISEVVSETVLISHLIRAGSW